MINNAKHAYQSRQAYLITLYSDLWKIPERTCGSHTNRRFFNTSTRTANSPAIIECSDIIYDRYFRSVHEKQANLYPFSYGLLAQWRLRGLHSFRNIMANGKIKDKDPNYNFNSFGSENQNIFYEFHNSLANGALHWIETVATSALYNEIKRSRIPYPKLVGTQNLTNIKSFSSINPLQARIFEGSAKYPKTTFAQITVQYISEAKIISRKGNTLKSPLNISTRRHTDKNNDLGYYNMSIDPRGGEYYWHSNQRTSTWKKPPNLMRRVVHIDNDRGSLGTYGITLETNQIDDTVQQEHIVVFEKPLPQQKSMENCIFLIL